VSSPVPQLGYSDAAGRDHLPGGIDDTHCDASWQPSITAQIALGHTIAMPFPLKVLIRAGKEQGKTPFDVSDGIFRGDHSMNANLRTGHVWLS
jgi:hypothetical protein